MSNTISIDEVAQEIRDVTGSVAGTVAESIKQHSKHLGDDRPSRWWLVLAVAIVAAVTAGLVWRARSGEAEVATDGLL